MDRPQHMLVLGATGKTGREIVQQALKKNNVVTAYVRNPSKITVSNKNLQIIQGDLHDSEKLTQALQGQDAVISALGPKKLTDTFMTPTTKVIIEAMKRAHVKRFIMLSSFAVHPDFKVPLPMKLIWPLMKSTFEDKKVAENLLRKTDLAWTIVYATRLTNGAHSTNYHVTQTLPKWILTASISRANVADFLIRCVTDTTMIHKMPIILEK